MMRRTAIGLILFTAGALSAGVLLTQPPETSPRHTVSAPKLAKIEALAELVTLRTRITDVQVTEITGYTGGVRCILVVRGEAELGTDLEHARFTDVDGDEKRAVLKLPPARVRQTRLDHDHTKVYRIDRTGLWRIVPGSAGEAELVNHAMQRAERIVSETAKQERLRRRARERAVRILQRFFEATGWRVRVVWAQR